MRGAASTARPRGTLPIIVFHGERDATVHPRNGEQIIARSLPRSALPAIKTGRAGNGHAYTQTVHQDGDGTVLAEHWLVHGAGHAWSGGSSRGSYTDRKGPDASSQMLRFFGEHAKA